MSSTPPPSAVGPPEVAYRCRDDEGWTMVELSGAVARLTGVEPGAFLGGSGPAWGRLIHPDDRARVRTAVDRAAAEGRSYRLAYRIRTEAGGERWVMDRGAHRPDGTRTGRIEDVTEALAHPLRTWEEALDDARRQARHLALLQEVTAVVNESAGLEAALRAALPAVCRGLDFTVAQVALPDPSGTGATGSRLQCRREGAAVHGEAAGESEKEAGAASHGSAPLAGDGGLAERVRREQRVVWLPRGAPDPGSPDGGRVETAPVASGVGAPIRTGDRCLAVLEFYADRPVEPDPHLDALLEQVGIQLGRAWEREQALRERRDGEARFRQLAEHIDDVFWIGSPSGPGRFYVSPAYRDIWGRNPADLQGDPESWLAAVHPDDRDRVEDVVRRRGSRGYEIHYRILRPDGTLRWIWDRAFPVLDDDGAVARVVGVAEDVTQRRKLEAQLRAAHRMEAVGRLAGGIAHDFNNLLTVIRGQSDLLLMDLPEGDPLVEEVEVVRDAADRAAKLTRQLLAFSREQVLRPRVVDLVEVVRKMEQLLARVLGEHIRIVTSFDDDLPPIRVDAAQLEQVLVNLAVNARDAMPDGGLLSIRARRERITPLVAAGRTELPLGTEMVRLDVTDDGHGMDEATRARIFEPFFTTKRDRGGTGLGLAMAYGIVKQSGGTIHVASTPGEGTTFELRFPPVPDERPAAEGDPLPPPEPGRVAGTILVVEDDPAVRRVASRTLRREGVDVSVAADAEQGLEILADAAGRISVLLTDLVLPGMSGRELLDEVRRRFPHIRCIAMSGYAEGSPERRVDLPPDVVFLPKPFTVDGLMRALAAAADRGLA